MGNPLEAMEALDGAHDVNGVVLTVDLYQKTRNDLVRDCSPGFEQRLVAQRNGADLCYAVHADGLVLLATPSGREAASDLILRLLQHGATCIAKEDYVVIRKKTLSKDEKKDLKSLLDVCTAFGVSFADYNSKVCVSVSVSRHRHASSPGMMEVGRFFVDFGPFRGTATRRAGSRSRSSRSSARTCGRRSTSP